MKPICRQAAVAFAAMLLVSPTLTPVSQAGSDAGQLLTEQSQTRPAPLKLLEKIPLPGVDGALDHMAVDIQGQRLFVPAEQHSTIEVLDVRSGRRLRTISDAKWPSTVFYDGATKQLFVSDRADGTCKVFNGETYELIRSIKLLAGADNAAYEPRSQSFYVANAGRHAGLPYTLISIINTSTSQHVGDIKVESANVQAMAFESSGDVMYADLADKDEIAVIDVRARTVKNTWPTKPQCQKPYALSLDSAHHRLFLGCRMFATQADWWQPGKMLVLDTDSGKPVMTFDAGGGADEMFFDAGTQRIYSQGYEGIADVWKEVDPDHYESIGKIQGGVHGKTSLLVPELNRYYVAVSEHQDVIRGIQGGKIEDAYIEVYEVVR
jgi:hypothetical protein